MPAGRNFNALLPAEADPPPSAPRPQRQNDSSGHLRATDNRAPPPSRGADAPARQRPDQRDRANDGEHPAEAVAEQKSEPANAPARRANADQSAGDPAGNAAAIGVAAPPQAPPAGVATVEQPAGAAPAVAAAEAAATQAGAQQPEAATKQPESDTPAPSAALAAEPNDAGAGDAVTSPQQGGRAATAVKQRRGDADLTQEPGGQKDRPDSAAAGAAHRDAVSLRELADALAFKPAPASASVAAATMPDANPIGSAAVAAPVGAAAAASGAAPAAPTVAAPAAGAGDAVPLAGLSVEIAARAAEGKRRFEIRLDPPELGRIDVRLDVARDGHVTSRLVVERAETLDLLRRDAASLERALQSAGLRTDNAGLQFSLRDQSQGRWSGFEAASRPNLLIVPDDNVAVREAVRRGYGALRGLGRGIDISV